MKRLLALSVICLIINCLFAQKPLSLASSFYNTLNNYVLYNDHIEYQKLMNMCDAGFRVSDRFAQEQSDIPSQSLLLQNYLELLRDKQVKLAITDMREITLSNHRTEGASTKTVLVNLTLSSPKTSTYKLQNVVYIRNNKIFCVGDYEIDKSGKVLTELVDNTNRTSTTNNIYNGHQYVDLGLSVMWATCNVGADNPYEYGDYFAWGETKSKEFVWWMSYKWCKGGREGVNHTEAFDELTKYCTVATKGTVDNKKLLDLSDDAARVNWGGSWRIPTQAEQDELLEKCTWEWTWTTQNSNKVNGYKITSKINGNSIFLPAAGYRYCNSLFYNGSYGYYWSSSLATWDPSRAYCQGFSKSAHKAVNSNFRSYGLPIRPVFSPQ